MKLIELKTTSNIQRLDRWLQEELPFLSRSYIQELIRSGHVTCSDQTVLKPASKLETNLKVTVEIPAPVSTDIMAQPIPLDIIYEDEWLLVVDKPKGMVVHPAAGHTQDTLVNALLYHCKGELSDINGIIRPGIVHRIDKDTSGLLLVVKNNQIHEEIAAQIRNHEMERLYRLLVYGQMQANQGTIDAPIGRDKKNRQRMAVTGQGKDAITHFELLARYEKVTHLQARLVTGRTHQIRVHMKYIGHPVLADPLYAAGRIDYGLAGQALHARQISFYHPVLQRTLSFESPSPDWFTKLLEQLV